MGPVGAAPASIFSSSEPVMLMVTVPTVDAMVQRTGAGSRALLRIF